MPLTIFEHVIFQGRSQVLTTGQYDNTLSQISIGNDSSARPKYHRGYDQALRPRFAPESFQRTACKYAH